jgi:hypothetical protein
MTAPRKRKAQRLVLYRATELLYSLLERGPILRKKAIAELRKRGIGINKVLAAAALIGVPPVPAGNKPGEWMFPHPIPHLPALLRLIIERGREVGVQARHQRALYIKNPAAHDWPWEPPSGGDRKVAKTKNAIPLVPNRAHKTHHHEFFIRGTS